ncbi:hypothetical protein [Streptomyces sp. RFCAC02]|uniref:hypothetical protein n=1 Tax=Streptomyces sp. RFCAC02 TaxID=2499143 RepID=UPI0010211C3A|nr:hypothetical protein [Streptomyces sp. RFCAC02]
MHEPRPTPAAPVPPGPPPGAAPSPQAPGRRPLAGAVPAGDDTAPEPTGNAAVDAALARLAGTEGLPVAGHTAVYEDVHRALRDTLAALDRPAPGK